MGAQQIVLSCLCLCDRRWANLASEVSDAINWYVVDLLAPGAVPGPVPGMI